MTCFGCNLANQKVAVNVVFEDAHVCCILDHDPYNEGHVLILPKKHAEYFDELDDHTANSVMKAAQLLSKAIKILFKPDGITICQNGGAFDDLTHFHMHVVPRYEGQNFADFYAEAEEVDIDEHKLDETRKKMIEVMKSLA
ncbi:HIT family protein [Metasolibacillus meyeri]|uniref:HIT family protein n=1 Tax=Metasolibacillus meyeri TaxID=1071052 RepID=UPI000D30DC7A|nr:HIT family protein [Metasolibacillus meyeri]